MRDFERDVSLLRLTVNGYNSNLLLYSLYYAEACNEFAVPFSALLRPGNTALYEQMLQRRRSVGNAVADDRPDI